MKITFTCVHIVMMVMCTSSCVVSDASGLINFEIRGEHLQPLEDSSRFLLKSLHISHEMLRLVCDVNRDREKEKKIRLEKV